MPRKLHPNLHMRGRTYYCFRNDENGKRREVSLRTDDLEIALQRYNTRSEEVKLRLAPGEMCKARLDDAAKRWLERRSLRFTKGTVRAERSIVRTLVRELKGDTKLEALAKIDKIYEFQDARLRSGISPKTINNEVQVLALILRDAKLWHRVQTSYKPMKCRPVDIADALTLEQQLKLIEVATHAEPFAVVPYVAVLALDTGMRIGEIKQLQLGDLHHEAATMTRSGRKG